MSLRRLLVIWSIFIVLVGGGGMLPQLANGAEMSTCASCRQPITSTFVQWGRLVYHPQHFVCAGCGKPLGTAAFVPVKGRPYHKACAVAAFAERCAVCGQPIEGQMIKVKGQSYHERCYQEAVAERCPVCNKPITGQYIDKDGLHYHVACFQNAVAERCAVCNAGMVGSIVIDPWGNRYHAAHARQIPCCDYCGRIISPRTTGGGYTYDDGRNVCAMCYKTRIVGDRLAKPVIDEVRERIAKLGLDVPVEAAPVLLVDRVTLRNLLRRTGYVGGPNVNGFTSVLTEKQGNTITKREMAVYLLYGMPREVFAGTLAHEFTHVWINLHNGRRLDPAFEEGSCNYFKYLLHGESDSDLAPYAIKAMQQDQDPNYGAGFRRVRQLAERKGLENLITLMGRSTGFPLGW